MLALHALKRCYELTQDLYADQDRLDPDERPPICGGVLAPKGDVIRAWPEEP